MKEKTTIKTHTLVVSDVHLGSPVCESRMLIRLLETASFTRLVLLGDIFDSLNFSRLCGKQWELFELIHRVSRTREVIWTAGNHDAKAFEFGCAMIGASPRGETETLVCEYGERKVVMMHGHQFDTFIGENPRVTSIASGAYLALQRLEPCRHRPIARMVKRSVKQWMRVDGEIGRKAVVFASEMGGQIAICGHTHRPGITVMQDGTYVNTGCWTDVPCTFVTISVTGKVKLRQMDGDGNVKTIAKV